MTGLVDPRAHAGAVKAALNAELNDKAFDYDEVPGMNDTPGILPNIYAAVSVERRPSTATRGVYTTGRTGWRIAVRCVAKTVDECRWALYHAALALDETRLTIDGTETTPIQFEADQAPIWDDGRYAALALYTYAH